MNYIKFYPKDKKYVSLFKENNQEDALKMKNDIMSTIKIDVFNSNINIAIMIYFLYSLKINKSSKNIRLNSRQISMIIFKKWKKFIRIHSLLMTKNFCKKKP